MTQLASLSLLLSLLLSSPTWALTIKVGVLAPEGTTWANNLKKMAKEVKKATKGDVKFKLYLGTAGDEPDILRKMRIGQLHGGIFTGRTLGDINGDVRVVELPFTFEGKSMDDEVQSILSKLAPRFDKQFAEKGFHNLGYFEVGPVYLVSTKKVSNLNELKGVKVWSWEGDKMASSLVKSLDLVSVPLALPNVYSSLSSGVVEAAYGPPMAIIGLNWHTKVNYLINVPVSYAVGAFLLNEKTWSKIPSKYHKEIEKISNEFVASANQGNRKDNVMALEALKKQGIQIVEFSEKDQKLKKEIRKDVIKKLEGNLISKNVLEYFESERKKL